MNAKEVLKTLRNECDIAGGVTAWSRRHKLNSRYVWMVLSGDRPPTPLILNPLGLELATSYRKKGEKV